jgi:hypothetical protein
LVLLAFFGKVKKQNHFSKTSNFYSFKFCNLD